MRCARGHAAPTAVLSPPIVYLAAVTCLGLLGRCSGGVQLEAERAQTHSLEAELQVVREEISRACTGPPPAMLAAQATLQQSRDELQRAKSKCSALEVGRRPRPAGAVITPVVTWGPTLHDNVIVFVVVVRPGGARAAGGKRR